MKNKSYKILIYGKNETFLHFDIDKKIVNVDRRPLESSYGVRGNGDCKSCNDIDKETGCCKCDPSNCLNFEDLEEIIDKPAKKQEYTSTESLSYAAVSLANQSYTSIQNNIDDKLDIVHDELSEKINKLTEDISSNNSLIEKRIKRLFLIPVVGCIVLAVAVLILGIILGGVL